MHIAHQSRREEAQTKRERENLKFKFSYPALNIHFISSPHINLDDSQEQHIKRKVQVTEEKHSTISFIQTKEMQTHIIYSGYLSNKGEKTQNDF